jgi:preprotein translocase subunit SecE
MNAKVEQNNAVSPADIGKYVVSVLIVVGGLTAFYWFTDWPTPLRAAGLVVLLLVALGVFMLTAKGRDTREFVSEARFELRKVIWPTRQETLRSTGLIIVVVIIVSILLAIIDFFISTGVRALLGS